MTDSATNRYGARKQSLGSNTNTWGDTKLNEVIDLLDRGSKGYQSYTVTGDATITWTNYVATNDGQVATLKLSGSPAAAFTLTFPSKEWEFSVWNATSVAATIKCSGGTGITIPASRKVRLFSDGTDVGDSTPNYLPTATTLTNNQDLVSKLQLETAIATASLPATSGTVLNSAADTTAGYHAAKHTLSASGALSGSFSTTSGGGDEDLLLTLSVGSLALTLASEQTAGFSAVAGNRYPVNIATTGTITFPSPATNGDTIGITNYGAGIVTFNWNGLKYLGSTTSLGTSGKFSAVFQYTNAATGWVEI